MKGPFWPVDNTDSEDLNTTDELVHLLGAEASDFSADAVIVATWDKIAAFSGDSFNRFQLAVGYTFTGSTYAIFDYRDVQFFRK